MRRRTLFTAFMTVLTTTLVAAPAAKAGGTGAPFQPDAWIKLCGQSLGCVIDPLPHPWRGKDIYNTTGRNQTEHDDINEGEGIRYWIAFENDGTNTDTFGVQGCRGNRTFELHKVYLGKHKRQAPGAEDLTGRYKRGTLTFELEAGEKVVITVNIITHDNKNVTYECVTTVTSFNDPDAQDVVIAEMTTF